MKILIHADEAPFYAAAVQQELGAGDELLAIADRQQAREQLPGCDVLVASAPRLDDDFLSAGTGLRWVHALTSGVDTLTGSRVLPPDAIITSSRGIHGPQMAETAMLLMLALARRFPAMLDNQARSRWERWPQPLLQGKHVVIVGVGSVARALAPRCKAMDMRVTGVASTAREEPGFDDVRARSELRQVLGTADFVVVLLPLDEQSRGLFDAGLLAALPPHAILVNLSRGGIVDEKALLSSLESGRLAGAGLDVFETEPLPADHRLWHTPNLIVTPHIGGFSNVYAEQALPPLVQNVRAMAAGRAQDLVNRVR